MRLCCLAREKAWDQVRSPVAALGATGIGLGLGFRVKAS